MKMLAMLLCCGGLLAAGVAITAPSPEETGVTTFEPVEPPFLTPRVRVANDRADSVRVWYEVEGTGECRTLGVVAGSATHTFALPEDDGVVTIVVETADAAERFVTAAIAVKLETDVLVEAARSLDQSLLRVDEMRVVRSLAGR